MGLVVTCLSGYPFLSVDIRMTPDPPTSPTSSKTTLLDGKRPQILVAGGSVYVSKINTWYEAKGVNISLFTQVTILNEAGLPVTQARVTLRLALQGGGAVIQSQTTDATGIAPFLLKTKTLGTYRASVIEVSLEGYTYSPTDDVINNASLTIP
jgi:hypothetical protein